MRDDDEFLRVDEFKEGSKLLMITAGGMVLHATTGDVPLQGRIAGGVKGISLTENDYCICNCVAKSSGFVVAITNKGNLKRTEIKNIEKSVRYRKGLVFGSLQKDEKLVFASWVRGDDDLVAKTEAGEVIHIPVEKITLTDRVGKYKAFPGNANVNVTAAWIHRRRKNN